MTDNCVHPEVLPGHPNRNPSAVDDCPTCTARRLGPYPVGSVVHVQDHDGTSLGPFTVVRSYWPKPVCELVDDDDPDRGMIRQNHDRILPRLPPESTP